MPIEIHPVVALVMVTLDYLSLHLQSYRFLKIEIQPMFCLLYTSDAADE